MNIDLSDQESKCDPFFFLSKIIATQIGKICKKKSRDNRNQLYA